MLEISLCMIVKNEENTIESCLRSIHDLVDEIIIVDTGSTDRTKEIVKQFTDHIYDFTWIDDFAAARNKAYSKATKEYTMWLDADDILKPEDRKKFIKMKQSLSKDINVIVMPYHYSFDEFGNVLQVIYRERVTKTGECQWVDPIHESLLLPANARPYLSDVTITHTRKHHASDRNFNILEKIVKAGDVNPRFLYYYGGELRLRNRIDEAIHYFELFFENMGRSTLYQTEACISLHALYCIKGQYKKALKLSLSCLEFSIQYSEFCCQLGFFYRDIQQNVDEALYWFTLALACEVPVASSFTISKQYYYYVPHMALGECYDKKGNTLESLKHYAKALSYKSDDLNLMKYVTQLKEQLF